MKLACHLRLFSVFTPHCAHSFSSIEIPLHQELCSENTYTSDTKQECGSDFSNHHEWPKATSDGWKNTHTRLLCHECMYFHYTTTDVTVSLLPIIYYLSKNWSIVWENHYQKSLPHTRPKKSLQKITTTH